MKTWGQWIEKNDWDTVKHYFSFQINENNLYRFHHWEVRDGWREVYGGHPLTKNPQCKFYIQFQYE